MSRKREILQLLEAGPRTTRELAEAMGVTVALASVYVADLRDLGVVRPVGEQPNAARGRPVTVWGVAK